MKLALFGASGMVGQRITQEALSRGHHVTAIVRTPANMTLVHPNLIVQAGTLLDPAQVSALVRGHDAVISAVVDRTNPAAILDATHSLIAGLQAAGVKRVIIVGGAGSLEVAPGLALVDSPDFPAEYRTESGAMRDALLVFHGLAAGALDWTMLCPSIVIMPGQRTGVFRVGGDQVIFDAAGQSHISAEDFAVALLNELEQPQHIEQRFTVGY